MTKLFFVLLGLAAVSGEAFAWKETGGGDEVGLEFRNAFATALRAVRDGSIQGAFTVEALEETVAKAHVIVVDESLSVRFGDTKQDSVAVNIPADTLIKVNRARWRGLKTDRLKEAVALHEVLSLMGIERTGYYETSARYLEKAGLSGWLVSGMNPGREQRPAIKTLSCRFTYLPPLSRSNADEELFTFTEKLKEGDEAEFKTRRTWTSKNGRFQFSATATQPFRTAYNPSAYEYVSVRLEDKQREFTTLVGPQVSSEPEKNESNAYLLHMSGKDKTDFAMLSAKCSLN
ncbi:MAG: hypothetical protein EOP11_09865 [Proteobacteria bacterium]|nr:MAG: hypothetical protein EOP11_09865 [Pseudomonadota bacterium]